MSQNDDRNTDAGPVPDDSTRAPGLPSGGGASGAGSDPGAAASAGAGEGANPGAGKSPGAGPGVRPPADAGAKPAPAAAGREAAAPGEWERAVLEKLVVGTLDERRRARRWSIFFRFTGIAIFALVLLLLFGVLGGGTPKALGRHTALVDVRGVIDAEREASAESVIEGLQAAFADTNTAGVVLRINSPGGSPVQAGIVYDEIRRLRAKYPSIPLYAVVEDVCASGGYYIAAAADRIYVDKASMIGSIGVLMDGFGFVGSMDKLGVERRLLTAGENKGMLDSFSPLSDKARGYAQAMIDEVHAQFIDAVRKGRGDRLKDSPEIFSGLVWNGARSVELGLADATGSVGSVARDVIKAEDIVDFSSRQNLAERLAKRVGVATGRAFAGGFGASLSAPSMR